MRKSSVLVSSELPLAMLLLFITAMFSIANWVTLPRYSGFDFCQLWGVSAAAEDGAFGLGSPYRHADLYASQFKHLEAGSGGALFTQAVALRANPDLTATPLLYSMFALLPGNYALSLPIFRCLQLLAFCGSVWILAGATTSSNRLRLMLTLLITAGFDPFMFDLEVGNINSLQLLSLIVLAVLAGRAQALGKSHNTGYLVTASILVLTLVMLKPNLGGPLAVLGLGLLPQFSWKSFAISLAGAIGVAVLLYFVPVIYFRAPDIWLDWWASVFRSVGRLAYPIDAGNRSASVYLADHLGMSMSLVMKLLAVAVIMPIAAIRSWRAFRSSAAGSGVAYSDTPIQRAYFFLSLGILLTFATSPLMWPHYYVLGLIPVFWLLAEDRPWSSSRVLGLAGLLLMAGLPKRFRFVFGPIAHDGLLAFQVLAWLPLWIGMLIKLAASRRSKHLAHF